MYKTKKYIRTRFLKISLSILLGILNLDLSMDLRCILSRKNIRKNHHLSVIYTAYVFINKKLLSLNKQLYKKCTFGLHYVLD